MTCDLLAFPSEFKAGLDLLPLNFKLGLGEMRGQGICDYPTGRKHGLLYDYQRAEDQGVNVICHNCVNDPGPIKMGELCLGFSQCLPGGKMSIVQMDSTKPQNTMPTILHSIPKISSSFFMPSVRLCDPALPILLPRLTLGLSRPSNTKSGNNGNLDSEATRKKSSLNSGFAPRLLLS
jgi:hypothetical protein